MNGSSYVRRSYNLTENSLVSTISLFPLDEHLTASWLLLKELETHKETIQKSLISKRDKKQTTKTKYENMLCKLSKIHEYQQK